MKAALYQPILLGCVCRLCDQALRGVMKMDWVKSALLIMDELEAFIIKATVLISVSIFCIFYLMNHVKDIKGSKYKRRIKNKSKNKRFMLSNK